MAATAFLSALAGCGGGDDPLAQDSAQQRLAVAAAADMSVSAAAADLAADGETVLEAAPFTPSSVLDQPAAEDGAREQAMALSSGSTLSSSYVLGQAETPPLFANQNWTIQCDGYSTKIWNIPESGIHGAALEDGSTLKFGKAADPLNTSTKTLIFRVNKRNRDVSGAQRCEATFNENDQRLPDSSVVWQAFRIYLPDWRTSSSRDTQTVMQWYHGNPEVGGLQPVLAMNISNNLLQFNARYSTASVPTKSNTVSKTIFRMNGGFQKRWLDVVIQGKISPYAGRDPFVKVWINGNQVASYRGPLGYNLPKRPQVKFGVYKFDFSTWDMDIPTREVRYKEMLLVRDPNRVYSESMVRAELHR